MSTLTQKHIEGILQNTEIAIQEAVFGKVLIASAKLPNGYVITVDSACVDPAQYDTKIGLENCISKITDEVWKLEGYRVHCENTTAKTEG